MPPEKLELLKLELRAEKISFAYDDSPVLDNVSLTLAPGQLAAVVGPNGSGKSTLLRILLGQHAPESGSVLLGGQRIARMPRRQIAAAIALVPQVSAAPFAYSVREMVLMARYHAHRGLFPTFETADDLHLADEAMWAMDVHHLAWRPITTLSGGERQRVMIARALCQQSPIVLLDEPTSSLDLHHQLELFEQMRAIAATGRSVLWVTHDLQAALQVAPRTIVMDNGKIVADGPSREVLTAAVLEPVYRVKVAADGDTLKFTRRDATTNT